MKRNKDFLIINNMEILRWVENNKKEIIWVSDFTPQKQGNSKWDCEEKIEKK